MSKAMMCSVVVILDRRTAAALFMLNCKDRFSGPFCRI